MKTSLHLPASSGDQDFASSRQGDSRGVNDARLSFRTSPLACVAASLVLGLPNLVAVAVAEHYAWGLRVWLTGMVGILGCLLATRGFGTAQRRCLLLLVFMMPGVIMTTFLTGSMPDSTLLWIAAEAHGDEISRFGIEIVMAGVLGTLVAWAAAKLGRYLDAWSGSRNGRAAWVLSLAMILPLALKAGLDSRAEGCLSACGKMLSAASTSYPGGSFLEMVHTAKGMWQAGKRRSELAAVPVAATATALPPGKREVYVLVIGESARATAFQINGYPRSTTPVLAATDGLLNFTDAASQATITAQSVPLLLTGTSAADADHLSQAPSLLKLFKTAGFKVYWLSTQQERGMIDSASAVFASEAHEALFLANSLQAAANANAYSERDSAILPELERLLARQEPRVLLVLHTMGSHWIYTQRYPAEFEQFPVHLGKFDFISPFTPPEVRKEFANAYDNTVLYTDHLLGSVIASLKQQSCPALMWYVSDHGENSAFADTMPCAHGTVTDDVVHVPMIVWSSAAYQQDHAASWATLAERQRQPVSSRSVFHSLAGAAGITSPQVQLSVSLASDHYQPSHRLVLAMNGTVCDYHARPRHSLAAQ